ncbi:pre-rRNA processing protein [Savitreella phatthalungensis]
MAGDAFFTKKRKRPTKTTSTAPRNNNPRSNPTRTSASAALKGGRVRKDAAGRGVSTRDEVDEDDEEIASGSDNDSFAGFNRGDDSDVESGRDSDASYDTEDEQETPAEKRLRLAKEYLAQIEAEIAGDEDDVDAGDIDRELIGERLAKDNLVAKERIYLRIADHIDWSSCRVTRTPTNHKACLTSVAWAPSIDTVYATYKDGRVQKWSANPHRRTLRLKKTSGRLAKAKATLCSAVDGDGETLATGGADGRITVWSCATLEELKSFPQHRDAVNGLAFPQDIKGSRDLYSASSDRTVKCFDTRQLTYIETLFGHQDVITDVSAVVSNTCITAGARDRTVRLWKVLEESQLVFRGGDAKESFTEGSLDCCAQIDKELFVTGSDNGTLALWSTTKKKALFRIATAHGLDPTFNTTAERDPAATAAITASARATHTKFADDDGKTATTHSETHTMDAVMRERIEADGEADDLTPPESMSATLSNGSSDASSTENADRDAKLKALSRKLLPGIAAPDRARWITAVAVIPFSDLVVTGSWDGYLRFWAISRDNRRLSTAPIHAARIGRGCVNAIVVAPNHLKAASTSKRQIDGQRDGWRVYAALGYETRLGRWKTVGGSRNEIVCISIPPTTTPSSKTIASTAATDS